MAPKPDIIEKVNLFITKLLDQGLVLDRVILFGSQVNGKADADSDVDLVLVSEQFSGFGFEDRKLFSKINIQPPFLDIETRTFSSAYFAKGDPFIAEILRTGIELFNANKSK